MVDQMKPLIGSVVRTMRTNGGRYKRALHTPTHNVADLMGAVLRDITFKGNTILFHMKNDERHQNEDLREFVLMTTTGSTGRWQVHTEPVDEAPHTRLSLSFYGDKQVAFIDVKNFGMVRIVSPAEAKRKLAELGPSVLVPEWLVTSTAIPEFQQRIRRFMKTANIRDALLNHHVISGVGEQIATDALRLIDMDPSTAAISLDARRCLQLWTAMAKVMKEPEVTA